MDLNVLVIGLDSTLALDEDNITGNARARHIEYAKYLSNLYIIVKTSKNIKRKVKKIKDNLFIYPTSSLNRYLFLYDAYNLAAKLCKENRIDLIVTQDPSITGLIGWLLKKKYNIPLNIQIAADVIDNNYFIKEWPLNFFLNKLGKWLIKKADSIRVSTPQEKKKLSQLGIDTRRIWNIPFFIDFNLYLHNEGIKIREQYLDNRFDKLVLFVGRVVKQKDLPTLVRAIPLVIQECPRCLFLIVGSGSQERIVKRLSINLKVSENIRFVGELSYKNIPEHFAICDIFTITSLYEGTCMALLEAAISKKPIISTKFNGAYDVILDGRTGYLVDFRDSTKIAERILYLIKNTQVAEEMGRRGRDFVLEQFNKEKILQHYFQMLETTARGMS